MTEQSQPAFRGHTRVRRAALNTIANAITAEESDVPISKVKATLHDRDGKLQLELETPLPASVIDQCRELDDDSVYQILTEKRHRIADRFKEMTNHNVSAVDLALTGVYKDEPERRVK